MGELSKIQRIYNLKTDRDELYHFFNLRYKCICLLCGHSIAVPKKHNIERHFQKIHTSFDTNHPLLQILSIKEENKSSLTSQPTVFTRNAENFRNPTIAPFKTFDIITNLSRLMGY